MRVYVKIRENGAQYEITLECDARDGGARRRGRGVFAGKKTEAGAAAQESGRIPRNTIGTRGFRTGPGHR